MKNKEKIFLTSLAGLEGESFLVANNCLCDSAVNEPFFLRVIAHWGTSNFEQGIHLGGANKVVLRQAIDGMCRVFHVAFVVAYRQFWVMVFAMRQPRYGVNERYGLIIVLEFEGLADEMVVLHPAIELMNQFVDLILRQRRHTALAGLALLGG